MVEVFREVRRVLRKDGTLWLNCGDSYAAGGRGSPFSEASNKQATNSGSFEGAIRRDMKAPPGLKPKDLVGIPWRVAFALQADGWWLRSDIIWAKPNPMPESVIDRPTKAHEYVFLLTESASYFYDAEAIKEPSAIGFNGSSFTSEYDVATKPNLGRGERIELSNRNKRTVWTVATAPYPEAHFATYPPDLIKPCILAGTSARGCCPKCGAPWERIVERVETGERHRLPAGMVAGATGEGHGSFHAEGRAPEVVYNSVTTSKTTGWKPTCAHVITDPPKYPNDILTNPCTVLDPFAGSGTTGQVALELGRKAVLIELNPKYIPLIEQRCTTTMGFHYEN